MEGCKLSKRVAVDPGRYVAFYILNHSKSAILLNVWQIAAAVINPSFFLF